MLSNLTYEGSGISFKKK